MVSCNTAENLGEGLVSLKILWSISACVHNNLLFGVALSFI